MKTLFTTIIIIWSTFFAYYVLTKLEQQQTRKAKKEITKDLDYLITLNKDNTITLFDIDNSVEIYKGDLDSLVYYINLENK